LLELRELDASEYVALRLPPAGPLQMGPHPSGRHFVASAPFLLQEDTLKAQKRSRLVVPGSQPHQGVIGKDDIVGTELRVLIRRDALCKDESQPDEEVP